MQLFYLHLVLDKKSERSRNGETRRSPPRLDRIFVLYLSYSIPYEEFSGIVFGRTLRLYQTIHRVQWLREIITSLGPGASPPETSGVILGPGASSARGTRAQDLRSGSEI